jgi:hypothetical protein
LCAHADSDTYSNSNSKPNSDRDADGYAYIHTKADAHTEDCTNAEGASDAGATTVALRTKRPLHEHDLCPVT